MSLYCRNCGALWDEQEVDAHIKGKPTHWTPCLRPTGIPMVDSGVGGHVYNMEFDTSNISQDLSFARRAIAAPMERACEFILSLGYPGEDQIQRLCVRWNGEMRPVFEVQVIQPDWRKAWNDLDVKLTWKIEPRVIEWPPPKA